MENIKKIYELLDQINKHDVINLKNLQDLTIFYDYRDDSYTVKVLWMEYTSYTLESAVNEAVEELERILIDLEEERENEHL